VLLELNRPSDASDDATKSLLDELMTAREIAGILQMRVSTVEGYARRGLLPSVKVGRHRRFIKSEVERAIALLLARRAWPPPAREDRRGGTRSGRPAGPDTTGRRGSGD
jgi:excisionase family DNA binding protein